MSGSRSRATCWHPATPLQ